MMLPIAMLNLLLVRICSSACRVMQAVLAMFTTWFVGMQRLMQDLCT